MELSLNEQVNKNKIRGFEIVDNAFRKFPNAEIILPTRGSKYSAGYDFYSNENITILPGEQHAFWTDVKAYMQDDEVLTLHVRSSIGIKKQLMFGNAVGIIDFDYYKNMQNDGNCCICLVNRGSRSVDIEKGERIAQGIFVKFLEADNIISKEERIGGIGSTNLKSA